MPHDVTVIRDEVTSVAEYRRGDADAVGIRGHGVAELYNVEGALVQSVPFVNLVTQVGDQFYGDRAAAIGSIAAVTGMRLGTGTTAVAKTGAGAAIVTYVTSSQVAITGGFPTTALSGGSRRITWETTWAAGVATATGIAEVVLTNESPLTDVAGAAANTVARVLLGTTVNKGASDSLKVTWTHDLLGA